jgi:hypothetical protein
MKHIAVILLTLTSAFFANANEYEIKSEFLQLLDFESPVSIYTEEETLQLQNLIEMLLKDKTECSLVSLDYYHRQPPFEDVEQYYSGLFPKLQFGLYGDVWQYEVMEASVSCADHIEDFKMTHFIEDGVKLRSSQGMFKTEDYWIEVRVSFTNSLTGESTVSAIYLSESNIKAGIGHVYLNRDSVVFDWESIKP